VGGEGGVAQHLPCARCERRPTGRGVDRLLRGESTPLRFGRKRGELNQAIGCWRGGRTTKIHALTDACCRPIAFLLTGGQVADCTAANSLLDRLLAAEILHGDKGYDTDAVRRKIESKGAAPNIPPKINRRWKNCFSPWLYRHRNAIERMFGRLKDFRRIATRYDRLALLSAPRHRLGVVAVSPQRVLIHLPYGAPGAFPHQSRTREIRCR
jgi:transposase